MEVYSLLNKFLDRSLCLDIGVTVGLQVSNIRNGYIQKPKDNIWALLIYYHDVVGPNNHDCQGYAEEDDEDYDCRFLCAGDGHVEAFKGWVDACVVVVEEELGVVEDEAVVIEIIQNEALGPYQGWL